MNEEVKEEIQEEVVEESPEEEVVEEVVEESPEEINPDDYEIRTRELSDPKIELDDDSIDPEDAKTIGAIVEKQTASVKKVQRELQDRLEVDEFLKDHPEYNKYRTAILKNLQHPVVGQIAVEGVASMVAGKDLLKLGAKLEREAQIKADSTKNTGTATRKTGGGSVDWTKATRDEFEAQKLKVLGQG
jgi:hypothetical protein